MGEGNISLKMRKSLFEFVPPFIQFVDSSNLVREPANQLETNYRTSLLAQNELINLPASLKLVRNLLAR